jgi:hypothetical protein
MTEYGIKMVWKGWKDELVIGFSDAGYTKWKNKIKPGTRMLVYETAKPREEHDSKGVKAIVGEIEVTSTFEEASGEPTPTKEHPHPVYVKVLRPRDTVKQISLQRIREIIKDKNFPFRETWYPLTEKQYKELLAEWN